MADRRRRRPKIANSDSECSEDESVVTTKREQKLSEGGKSCTSNDGSDEDSVTEDNEDETGEEETEEGTEYEEEEEDEYKDGLKGERQSGDGQEQPESLDDDEDRKNPAYIPRRGAFYEHDTRISEDVDPKETARAQKKLWVDKGKWGHDRFVDTFQAPKSTEEIIAEYGYDIRAYDTPPDAPPKSFGRGRRDRSQSNKLGDFIDMGAGGDGYHNNRGGYAPRWRGGRGGDGGRYSYSQMRDGGDGRTCMNNQKHLEDKYDQDYPIRDSYSDNRYERNRGGYHDNRMERNRGGYHDNRAERNRDDFHDDRSERNHGSYHNDRPENNRGGYRDNRPERNRRVGSQEKYYDRGDGYEYDNRQGQPMNRVGRNSRGNVGTETPGEEDERHSPQRNARQWTNSSRGGANRRGSGPTVRGVNRYSPQTQRSNMQASEYPPTTIAPSSRSSQDHRNIDRVTTESTSVNLSNETQDVRRSKSDRSHETHGRNYPTEHHREADRQRHDKVAVPPSIVPPTTIASTKRSHASVTTTAIKHDTTATTVPSGGTTQNRPKRYSTQRQRNAPEVVAFVEPVVTETQPPPPSVQAVPAPRGMTSPSRPLRRPAPAYFQPVYATQPPTVFHPRADHSPPHTVASFPRQHPPHLLAYTIPGNNQIQSPPQIYSAVPAAMAPPPASLATAQPNPIIAQQYIAGSPMLNYVQPGQPAPYQLATGPPATMPFPAQQQVQPQPQQPQPQQPQPQQDAIHMRGGTVYFNPDVQQQLIPSRSPVRRVKVAIPIVNPEEVQTGALYIEMGDNQQPAYAPYYRLHYEEDGQPLEFDDLQDAKPDEAGTGTADPELDKRTEFTSGSDENSQEVDETENGDKTDLSGQVEHEGDTSLVMDDLKNIESQSSSANERVTTEFAVVEGNVQAVNEKGNTENHEDITDVQIENESVLEDNKLNTAEITEGDKMPSLDNVGETSEVQTRNESNPVCTDKVDEEHTQNENDIIRTDEVEVTREAMNHKTDHASDDQSCDDHTTVSGHTVVSIETTSQGELAKSESDPSDIDMANAESTTTKTETSPANSDDLSSAMHDTEAEIASTGEPGDANLEKNLINAQGDSSVCASICDGDNQSMQLKNETKPADREDLSMATEPAAKEVVKQEVSPDSGAEEANETFVDAEDGSYTTDDSDIVKDGVTGAVGATANSSTTGDIVTEKPITGGTPV